VKTVARLLLVEDESISRFQLTHFLTDEGYTVIPVGSGEEALKLLCAEMFDAVLTDFKLTGPVRGTDILKSFERVSPGKGKLLITAYPEQDVGTASIGALYVPKPVQLDDLLQKLRSVAL
jgi:ATP-dependent Lon protease